MAATILTAPPARGEDAGELQLGGFLSGAEGAPEATEDRGGSEIGTNANFAYPTRFAPAGQLGPTSGSNAVGYFTPRFGGLQFGAIYASPQPTVETDAGSALGLGQEATPAKDLVLGVTYLESFWGVDFALTGGYRSSSLPGTNEPGLGLSDQDTSLHRYSVGTTIGFSGLRLGGSFARDVGDGSLSIQSWDAGVSYAAGPWTVGVDYLQSDFNDPGSTGVEGQALQAGLTYSVGPGIVASFNVRHSSGEDRDGNANGGTLGILGFSYNF